jgi:putative tryptophan/tyrosine transport system substrate-binding protein
MEKTIWIGSLSGPNRKSKTCTEPRRSIQNPKWLGLFAIVIAFVGLTSVAEAQQPKKLPRIGYLTAASAEAQSSRTDAFRQGLRDLGYVEGKNIVIEYRHAEGNPDRLPELAADLVRLKVDVFVVQNNTVARAAVGATKTIPIVIANGTDPVAGGLVASLAHPGGNITGLTNLTNDLGLKRLELLKEIVPKLARVAVLLPPGGLGQELQGMQAVAPSLQLQLHTLQVRVASDFEKAFEEARKARAGALAMTADPTGLFVANQKRIVELAVKNRLPAIYNTRGYANAGGLMSYAADDLENFRRTATYVDKILKGKGPGELPIEQPRKFELVINLKAAKEIGLAIPETVLYRADKVIK